MQAMAVLLTALFVRAQLCGYKHSSTFFWTQNKAHAGHWGS